MQRAFSDVSEDNNSREMFITTAALKWLLLQCAFSDVFGDENFREKAYHNGCIKITSPQCEFSYALQ